MTPATVQEAQERLAEEWEGHRWILRIRSFPTNQGGSGEERFDVDLNPDARNWYLRVPHPDRSYEATIGLITRQGTFYPFARSQRVVTPRDEASQEHDSQWTIEPEQEKKIYELSGGSSADRASHDLGSAARGSEAAGSFSGMLGSMGGGQTGIRPPQGFWLQAETELVLYGATKPDAQLTVQGRPVPLRADGTFTVRLQLPDGEQEIACVATSADGKSERVIVPIVRRETRSSERELSPDPEAGN